MKQNVGILLFDDVEVLDFAGPFEVFSVTSQLQDHTLFDVFTVGKTTAPVRAINGLSVNPTYDFAHCPPIDILIVPGGDGTKAVIQDNEILTWVQQIHEKTSWTLSVCSGSRILGVLGLLDFQLYCTHHEVYDSMKVITPSGKPQPEKRYVQAGKIFTSGGISAGIDLSFHLVEKLHGEAIARSTATYMEYRRESA
ncbi:MAG: DJ-1/PfpI family protein [Bacteroidota bacterium]